MHRKFVRISDLGLLCIPKNVRKIIPTIRHTFFVVLYV